MTPELHRQILAFQRNEISEYHIYSMLAQKQKLPANAEVLRRISMAEKAHYLFWKSQTEIDVSPNWFRVWFFYFIARIFGLTFGIKLMERGENNAHATYMQIAGQIPDAARIASEEGEHEQALIKLVHEEKLNYVGSIVLGLNDALVELTGALAGFSFAFQDTQLIALAGLITGIAASFSMAASEYLSTKSEEGETTASALKSSLYTGSAYLMTVVLLILPYLLFANFMVCLTLTLSTALFIIFVFNYYLSVAKDLPFFRRFAEMAVISLGVAALTFTIGFLLRKYAGIDV